MSPHLTKRLLLTYLTCPKKAWLLHNAAEPEELTLGQQFRIEQGIEIGEKARQLFPGGILIEQKDTGEAAKRTQELLNDTAVKTLFEATFLHNGYAAKADILIRNSTGWEMIEVKSATAKKITGKNGAVKDPATNGDLADLVDDMAYTALIMGKNGLAPATIRLMVIADTFELGMDTTDLFVSFDLTRAVQDRVAALEALLEPAAAVLAQADEPSFTFTGECRKCDFFSRCLSLPAGYTIFDIPRLQEKQLMELYGQGILLVQDIPADFRLTETQKEPVACMRTGRVSVHRNLHGELARIRWPAHYLDFETTQTAFPLYGNVRPYEMIATQYSVHTCTRCGEVACHKEFLADPGKDCRRELAEALVRDLDGEGSVLSYSSYEAQVIKGLIDRYPDLAEPLAAILERIVDLLPSAKCISHPEFRGSNSIKRVLPVLVPAMTYDGLPIANGEDALVTFAWMARGKFTPEECAQKREEMLRYCEQDTLAMVKIHEVFVRMAGER